MELSEVQWGYVAGYIDADGCITLVQRKERNCKGLRGVVQVAGTVKESIRWFHKVFGGSFCVIRPQKQHYRKRYQWSFTSPKGIEYLLKGIVPLLKVKKQQADLLLKWLSIRRSRKGVKGRSRGSDGRFVFVPPPQEELDILNQIQELNRHGRKTR